MASQPNPEMSNGVASGPNTSITGVNSISSLQISTDLPKHSSTRNFSRKLYTPEPSDNIQEEEAVSDLSTTVTDLSFITLTTPEPLTLLTGEEQAEQSPNHTEYHIVCSRPSSRAAHSSQSSPLQPSNTGLGRFNHKARPSVSKSILESFFSPYAAPGPEDYPQAEDFEMERRPAYTRSPSSSGSLTGDRRQTLTASTTTFANTVGEKLGWLRSRAFSNVSTSTTHTSSISAKVATSPHALQQRHEDSELTAADPLFNLDIQSYLFPDGPADSLDPASFNTLLTNATSLIETLQSAYKSRTIVLNDIRANHAAQTDELDESETRARHLKMQLSDMSSRMADTETSLRGQLLDERKRREQLEQKEKERAMRRRTSLRSDARSNASDSGFESDGDAGHTMAPLDSPIRFGKDCLEIRTDQIQWRRSSTIREDSELAMENYMLQQRVTQLEGAVDACLQLI